MIMDGEEASFSMPLSPNDVLNCVIRTSYAGGADVEKSPSIGVELENEVFTLEFKDFNSPAGHHTSGPIIFGVSDNGEDISFLASINKFKAFTKIDFQLMLGAVEGGTIV
jgi:hypothetical protein